MKNSSYKVVSTDYLEHYGVKGMKWGVVHDDEKERSALTASNDGYHKRGATGTNRSTFLLDRTMAIGRQNQAKKTANASEYREAAAGISKDIAEQLRDPETRENVETVLKSEEMHEATSELIDIMKDVALDKLEDQNPTVGKIAKKVDRFLTDFMYFSIDFTKGVNEVIDYVVQSGSNLVSWGKKLFGG